MAGRKMNLFLMVWMPVLFTQTVAENLERNMNFFTKKVKAGMGIMFMHYGVHPTKEVGEKNTTSNGLEDFTMMNFQSIQAGLRR